MVKNGLLTVQILISKSLYLLIKIWPNYNPQEEINRPYDMHVYTTQDAINYERLNRI